MAGTSSAENMAQCLPRRTEICRWIDIFADIRNIHWDRIHTLPGYDMITISHGYLSVDMPTSLLYVSLKLITDTQ